MSSVLMKLLLSCQIFLKNSHKIVLLNRENLHGRTHVNKIHIFTGCNNKSELPQVTYHQKHKPEFAP